jgi:hypothetical protein
MGIATDISPGSIYVYPDQEEWYRWTVEGSSAEILNHPEWDQIPPDERLAAQWHRRLLADLFYSWHSNFVEAVRTGAAHIMARKKSVLAPFERVTWDQWQFFRLDEVDDRPPAEMYDPLNGSGRWHDPRGWSGHAPSTATGPSGERLYSIYVAPGLERKKGLTAEQKCRQWLLGLMRDYPHRPPEPRGRLAEQATLKFPGLSKRGFERCYFSARVQTGNANWSRPGAPSKSPQESPQKK